MLNGEVIRLAGGLWNRGLNTHEIASKINEIRRPSPAVQECDVANCIQQIKFVASVLRKK